MTDQASHLFLGPAWNLLLNNCNHFTSYLCERLTGQPAPRWLNRAATIGLAMPCMVPRDWISPPAGDNEDGELVNEDEEDYSEDTAMLAHGSRARLHTHGDGNGTDESDDSGTSAQVQEQAQRRKDRAEGVLKATSRSSKDRDASGWPIPKSERAPLPANGQAG